MSRSIAFDNRSRSIIGLLALGGLTGVIWAMTNWILTGSTGTLVAGSMVIALVAIVVGTLNDWRVGVLLFIVWLLFEDLARKFLGNGLILFFGKDVLAAITYVSLWRAKQRGEVPWFRPSFLPSFALFFVLAFVQVFNTWTPSVLYGFLGLKLYFYYFPLMYAGYAFVRNRRDLEHFLVFNVALGVFIALLGIIQSIVGLKFLNPATLAPELQELGNLTRYAPISHRAVPQPTSVFVSTGRFATYIILLVILALSALAYFLITRRRHAAFGFLGLAVAVIAAIQSGSRGSLIFVTASILVLWAGFFWGASWTWGQGRRRIKVMGRGLLVGGIILVVMVQFSPNSLGASWAFYSETLSPTSPASELQTRTWDYPLHNLITALHHPRWLYGDGTGTASLGMQYVARLLGQAPISFWVEHGWGTLILEMGILGPILWIVWTSSLLYCSWKIVRELRGTTYFPVALSIFWYAFILLVLFSYNGMAPYQNFVMNAYLWLLIGVLFRLPHLARHQQFSAHAPQLPSVRETIQYAGGV